MTHWRLEGKMKKINFEIIKKVDYLLVFIAAVIGLIALLVNLISEIFPIRGSQPAHIEIIDSRDEEAVSKITESIDFLEKIKDVYVFSVTTSAIKSDDLSKSNLEAKQLSNIIQKSSSASKIINFIFVKDEQETLLFPSKVFIYKYQLSNDNSPNDINTSAIHKNLHNFNIDAVIKEDTNRDKQLDSKDKIALYVSNYDGKNLKEISSSVYYLDCIDKNTFLFSEYEDGKVTFYEYDGNFEKVTLIKTVQQELSEKRIILWQNKA